MDRPVILGGFLRRMIEPIFRLVLAQYSVKAFANAILVMYDNIRGSLLPRNAALSTRTTTGSGLGSENTVHISQSFRFAVRGRGQTDYRWCGPSFFPMDRNAGLSQILPGRAATMKAKDLRVHLSLQRGSEGGGIEPQSRQGSADYKSAPITRWTPSAKKLGRQEGLEPSVVGLTVRRFAPKLLTPQCGAA